MKKFATRVLALVIALSMLLVSTAFAAERNAAAFSIGNLEIIVGEQTITLPVTLTVGGGVDIEGMRGYLTADVSTQTASAISALAAFENGEIKAYLNGMDYGFTIPLEQLVSLLEAQLGMSVEEALMQAMSSIDPEIMNTVTEMMDSMTALQGVEADPEALMAALGVTLTEQGEAAVTLFDVETTAAASALEMKEQTYKELFDALSTIDPAMKEYLDQYFGMMNESLAATGEEMTVEDLFAMITISMSGMIYESENGALVELTMNVSVEEETISIPFFCTTLTDELGTYTEVSLMMDVDGETVYLGVYADDYIDTDSNCTSFILSGAIGDTASEESDVSFDIAVYTVDSPEADSFYIDLAASDYGEVVSGGIGYIGYPVVSTEATDSYSGILNIYANADGMNVDMYADTNLTLSNVPAGELLTFAQSINPLEADEETLNQAGTDAINALMQGAGVLMQDPTLSSLFGGMMG